MSPAEPTAAVPRISVVIPCYNSAGTIRAALDSVSAQTVGAADVVVVDDGSMDDTVSRVRAYRFDPTRGQSPSLRVLSTGLNVGPAGARNRGVEESTGEWIAFLDSDDGWLPRRLEIQLSLASAHRDIQMWCGRTVDMDSGSGAGGPRAGDGAGGAPPLEPRRAAAGGDDDRSAEPKWVRLGVEDFVDMNPVATSTVLVRREVLRAVGGFDPRFRGPEDYDLWMRIAATYPVGRIQCPLSRYRHGASSLSMDDRKFLGEVLRVIDKAYAPGGALWGRPGRRRTQAYQHLCAAWMASERGAPCAALGLFGQSAWLWPWAFRNPQMREWGRVKLLTRILRNVVRRRRD